MSESYSNEFDTTLASAVLSGDGTISVNNMTGAPAVNFRVKVNSEIMLVRSVSGSGPFTLTVDRGQEGTTATAHSSGDDVIHVLTAEGLGNAASGDMTRRIYWSDECNFRTAGQFYNDGFVHVVSGTSANSISVTSTPGHPGIVGFSTGSTTTGRAALNATTIMFLGLGRMRFGNISRVRDLSDGTNTFTAWMGWTNIFTSANPNPGIYFRYTHSVNSGKWQAVCANGGIETAVDTGVTATALGWNRFEIDINAAGTEVKFYIDNVLVATITTDIPDTTDNMVPFPLAIFKSAGTTARVVELDAFWYQWDLTTAR